MGNTFPENNISYKIQYLTNSLLVIFKKNIQMKKFILSFLICFPLMIFAQSMHTIVIDGINNGWTQSEKFTNVSSADTAYLTWDTQYLYFGVKGVNASDSIVTYNFIDINPCGNIGSDSAYAWGHFVKLPFKADYVIVWKNKTGNNYIEVRKYNNTNHLWERTSFSNTNALLTNQVNFSIGTNYRECRIKFSLIESPQKIKFSTISDKLNDSLRFMAFPSQGWTDIKRTSNQLLPNNYYFPIRNYTSPNNVIHYNWLNTIPITVSSLRDTTICEHQNIRFVVHPNGSQPLTYQWKKNNVNLNGQNDTVFIINNTTSSNSGGYICQVRNFCDTISTNSANLFIKIAPTVQTQPQNSTSQLNSSASFSLRANGTRPFYYQWYHNTILMSGYTDSNLVLNNIQQTNAGAYYCIVSNSCGQIISNQVNLYTYQSFCGSINSDTTWLADTIRVTCDIDISNSKTLTIQPHVIVKFMGNYRINVNGRLLALGNRTKPITFIPKDTIGLSNMTLTTGGWHGIRFNNTLSTNDTSKLYYCNFYYGKAVGTGNDRNGGFIFANNYNKISIYNCSFIKGRAADDGGAMYLYSANIKLLNNNLLSNIANRNGGGIYLKKTTIMPVNNIISLNQTTSATSFGGGIYCDSSNLTLVNNLISKNVSRYGAGIFLNATISRLNNNTIANNIGANMGGGLFCVYSNPILTNCILQGNVAASFGPQVYLDPNSDPDFYYCNIQGGIASIGGPGSGTSYNGINQNCIIQDALFKDITSNNFTLQNSSPCINAGSISISGLYLPAFDINWQERVNNSLIDIGAYEYMRLQYICGHYNRDTLLIADTIRVLCDVFIDSCNFQIKDSYVEFQGHYAINYFAPIILTSLYRPFALSNSILTSKDTVNGWNSINFYGHSVLDSLNYIFKANNSTFKHAKNLTNGGAINLFNTYSEVKNCYFYKNSGINGGAIYLNNSISRYGGNIFYKNNATSGGAIYAQKSSIYSSKDFFANNIAINNGGAIYIKSKNPYQDGYNKYSIFANNQAQQGGGIFLDSVTNFTFYNSDIVNNKAILNGGGIYFRNNSNNSFNSCIIYGNSTTSNQNIYIEDNVSDPNFKYSDIQGAVLGISLNAGCVYNGQYINNIDADPLFVSPSSGSGSDFNGYSSNWNLQSCSPVYNLGDPTLLNGTFENILPGILLDNITDIGAYEMILPTITQQPLNVTICNGDNSTFIVGVNSSITVAYQWQRLINSVWTDTLGATSSSLTINNIPYSMNGRSYRCIISAGCISQLSTNTVLLTVNQLPSIIYQPHDTIVCEGGTLSFTTIAQGSNLTYAWQVNVNGASWGNITGNTSATTSTLVITNVCASCLANTTFRCVVSGTCSPSVTTNTVNVTVNLLPRITQQPSNLSVCESEAATFSVQSSGTNISYQWQVSNSGGLNWHDSTNAINSSINIPITQISMNNYMYRCVVSGICLPSITSIPVTLTVQQNTDIVTQPQNIGMCAGNDTVFRISAIGNSLVYQWQTRINISSAWTNISGNNNFTSISNAQSNISGHQYRCVVNGLCGTADTSNIVTLTVFSPIAVSLGSDFTMLATDTITINATTGFVNYQWSINSSIHNSSIEIIGANLTGNNPHEIIVTATDNNGCSVTDNIFVNVINNIGINEMDKQSIISICPNPSNGNVFLQNINEQMLPITIDILNIEGQLIYSKIIEKMYENNLYIDNKGIYIMNLSNNQFNIQLKLIIL